MALEFHPLANVLPLMEGEPFAELVADIKANGLREPVMVFEGKILDGRNRFRACQELGVSPDLEYLNGQDPVAFVLSMNVHRRHLNESQRAIVAARIATMKRGRPNDKAPIGALNEDAASKALNVGERTVQRAKVVLNDGTQEEIAAVESGKKSVSAAAKVIKERKRRAEKADEKKANGTYEPAGARVKVPDGITIEQWCRSGLALEGGGATPEAAAKEIGFPVQSYRKTRDIIHLADRDDLSERDSSAVRNALDRVNRSRRVTACHEMVQPIAKRVWGNNKLINENKRREQFETALTVIGQACSTGADLDIPHLSQERAAELISQLECARKQLGGLISKLKDIYA